MKRLLLSIFSIAVAGYAVAAIHTVSNSVHMPAQFVSIQEAHDAASAGDTLLVQGTNMSYGNLIVSKQIFVYGNTALGNNGARVNTITLNNGTCNGSVFESLNAYTLNNNADAGLLENITLRRCTFAAIGFNLSSAIPLQNWLIEGCVFTAGGPNAYSITGNCNYGNFENFTIRNNVFYGKLSALLNCTVENCIFLSMDPVSPSTNCSTHTNFSNNIYYGASPAEEYYSQNNSYYNNISFGGTPTTFPIQDVPNVYPFNVGADNQDNVNPMFVSVPINTAYQEDFNFNLQSGSPAAGAGQDGENMGVYNTYGYFRADFEPTIPVVRSVTLPAGNTVPAEGTFQIIVNSVSHQ